MKVLHLTLKKKWFDMILSGEKWEEYREIKPHWSKRISNKHTHINFVNGYGSHRPWMLVRINNIDQHGHMTVFTGLGLVKWGAPEREPVFILKLGKIIDSGNIQESL